MDPKSIADLIVDEHPHHCPDHIISGLWHWCRCARLLPEDIQPEVVGRIATLETVQPDALKELEMVMQRKFATNTNLRASQVGGVQAAAKIMNFTKQDMETHHENAGKR